MGQVTKPCGFILLPQHHVRDQANKLRLPRGGCRVEDRSQYSCKQESHHSMGGAGFEHLCSPWGLPAPGHTACDRVRQQRGRMSSVHAGSPKALAQHLHQLSMVGTCHAGGGGMAGGSDWTAPDLSVPASAMEDCWGQAGGWRSCRWSVTGWLLIPKCSPKGIGQHLPGNPPCV